MLGFGPQADSASEASRHRRRFPPALGVSLQREREREPVPMVSEGSRRRLRSRACSWSPPRPSGARPPLPSLNHGASLCRAQGTT
ncbi:hypothetical protein VULLAG_LOCUS16230 [Vulpes lagopus]